MPRICDIYDVINAAAPFDTAMSYDNVGLLVGEANTPVTRVLLALDVTPAVVEEAVSMNANLIISHHPVIFHPLKSLGGRDVPYLLAKSGVAALCCHTNLDSSPICGVNTALSGKLGLRSLRAEDVFGEECVLFSGELAQAVSPHEFAALVKERLGLKTVCLIPGARPVKRVFLCGGAGGEYVNSAAMRGADAYLTGEMHHHEVLEAARTGLTSVVAGHYETEKPVVEFLAAYLRRRFPETAFLTSRSEKPSFEIL